MAGEAVDLVDGEGRRVRGRVAAVMGKDALDVEVVSVSDEPPAQPTLVVAQALPKGDRGELAVELLTEVGVDEIIPWAAANCITRWRDERAGRSWQKWADAATAAGKQSRRARFPTVAPLASTDDVIARVAGARVVRLGPSVLRTSSAGMAAAAVLLSRAGRWSAPVGPDTAGMEG